MCGLASMYPAFDWSTCSRPSWILARVRSHYRTGLIGPFGALPNGDSAFQQRRLSGTGPSLAEPLAAGGIYEIVRQLPTNNGESYERAASVVSERAPRLSIIDLGRYRIGLRR